MNELYHWGIIGQKWGRRRYQNEDGSYTAEGKERYGRGDGSSKKSSVDDWLTQKKRSKDKPPISPAETVSNKTKEALSTSQDLSATAAKYDKKRKNDKIREQNKEDLSQLSDEEIRARINRMNLERQYNDLTTRDTQSGYETVTDILGVVKDVAIIGGTIVSIAATVKSMNKD